MRTKWTEELIGASLLACARHGMMPSANQLRELGRNDLACAITRWGGFREWARKTGLLIQDSATSRGVDMELDAISFLEALGFHVERQTTKAPFDLLVGEVRVDVKRARYSEYGATRGFIFQLHKVPPTCDVYLLCCVDGAGVVLDRYYVPASEAAVQTITITKCGKYEKYRNTYVGVLR